MVRGKNDLKKNEKFKNNSTCAKVSSCISDARVKESLVANGRRAKVSPNTPTHLF